MSTFNPNTSSFGLHGHEYITSSDDYSAKEFYCFQAFGGDAVVSYTDTTIESQKAKAHTSKTIPGGTMIFGNISSLSVTSGTVVAYYKAFQR